eukprot:263050_1
MITNDISTHFIGQKETNEIYTYSFRNNWVTNSKTSTTINGRSYSTIQGSSVMSFKVEFYHVHGKQLMNRRYPGTMESYQWLWMLMRYFSQYFNQNIALTYIYELKIDREVIKSIFR